MRITDIEVIAFRVPRRAFQNGAIHPERLVRQTLTRIRTDEDVEGYYLGGHNHGDQDGLRPDAIEIMDMQVKPLLIGQYPFDRERFWHWLWAAKVPENILSVVDMALWDLHGRMVDQPIHKLLGGCRDKVKAYASTFPNMGTPEDYAAHASQCKERGYRAYKIHPYMNFDPNKMTAAPGRPSFVDNDLSICRAVRAAVGDHIDLMYDPWGTYQTYEEALHVGKELEQLRFVWYEHPMPEYKMSAYVKLSRELSIPILAPEIAPGSIFTRAEWILREASDMSRIDVLRGGITGCKKLASICEALGQRCEIHMSGFGNLQVLAATHEDVCQYYERGLLAPAVNYEEAPPYLEEICDPLDDDGFVQVPQGAGMGYKIKWDYILDNRI